jgi:short-subunit dehydrogenase
MAGVRVMQMPGVMQAFPVAEEGWLEARIGKRTVVPGTMNKLSVLMGWLLPTPILTRLIGRVMSKG